VEIIDKEKQLEGMNFNELQEAQNLGKRAEMLILTKIVEYLDDLIRSRIEFELPEDVDENFLRIEYFKTDLKLHDENQIFFISIDINNICIVHAIQNDVEELFNEFIKSRSDLGILEVESLSKYDEDEKKFKPGIKVKLSAEVIKGLFNQRQEQQTLQPVNDTTIEKIRDSVQIPQVSS